MSVSPTSDATARATAAHEARWGPPGVVVRAPGRVNLIGEHTDYNDGFALPMALPFDTAIAISDTGGDRASSIVEISAEGFGAAHIDPTADPRGVAPWARHLAGVVHLLSRSGLPAGGWRGTLATDVPIGAGLSSSAALEVASIVALHTRAEREWSPLAVAQLGQRVENEIVGVPSGIMDQLISVGAVDGHASLMDCRALTLDPCPIPEDVVIAVIDTGTRRLLVDGAYADRRDSCERAAIELGVAALRDATLHDATSADVDRLTDADLRRRARHVVTENRRTLDAAIALRAGDVARLGELMTASHASLRDDFEVSGPALDAVVATALAASGCLGARMTGGGFAGCAVALVAAEHATRFVTDVERAYRHEGHAAIVWVCRPAAGAAVVSRGS